MDKQTNGYIRRFRRIVENWGNDALWEDLTWAYRVTETRDLTDLERLYNVIASANKSLLSLCDAMEQKPPLLEEGRTAIAIMYARFKEMGIPRFDLFAGGCPVEVDSLLHNRLKDLIEMDKDRFEDLSQRICQKIWAFVANFAQLYEDIALVAKEENPLYISYGNIAPPAGEGSPGPLYIQTSRSRSQLECLYGKLIEAGFVEPGRFDDFKRCFEKESAAPGRIRWIKKARSGQINKAAVCYFLDLFGIPRDLWGDYSRQLFDIALSPSNKTAGASGKGTKDYRTLREIISNQGNE